MTTDATPTTLHRLIAAAGSIGAAIEAVHMDLDDDHETDEIAAAMADIRATACIVDGAPYYSDSIADDVIDALTAQDVGHVLALVDQLAAPGADITDDVVTDLLDRIVDVAPALTEGDAARIITTVADATDPTFSGVAARVRDTLRDNTDLELDLFND